MVATVHYLSMNVHSGRASFTAPVVHAVSATFNVDSLTPSLSHTIIWGDATGNTIQTSSGTGTLSATHTYVAAGTFTVTVTETAGGRVVGSRVVVVT